MSIEIDRETMGIEFHGRVCPEQADLSAASIKRFLKLSEKHSLVVQVQAAAIYVKPTYYLTKGENHNIGDLRTEGFQRQSVFLTATNLEDFYMTATWHGGKFDNAFAGGPRLGSRKLFTQITKFLKEVDECLS